MNVRQKTNFRLAGARAGGFSLVEIMIGTACAAIIGLAAFSVQYASMTLFKKNNWINANHEGARKVMDRLEREIQSSISIPALVGTNRDVLDTTGPAPGIAFLRQSGPLRQVSANATAGSNVLTLDANGPTPLVGQRLLIPAYEIEGDIVAVSSNSVTLATTIPIDVKITNGALSRNIIAVITDVVAYVVVDGQLREYQNAASNDYILVAQNITEPNPFGLPFNVPPNTTSP